MYTLISCIGAIHPTHLDFLKFRAKTEKMFNYKINYDGHKIALERPYFFS